MNNPIKNLEQLVEAVEQAGVDIAPSYEEYMPMAFAVANDCGEAGRPLFHRLCRLSDKYHSDEADKLYSEATRKRDGKNTLGTVYHLAEVAGVEMKKLACPPPPPLHVCDTYSTPQNTDKPKSETDEPPLPPPFPEYQWPKFLQQSRDCGENSAQRDILLLGALTVLGATLNKLVCFNYGHKFHYPCLQTFVLAPPASGKGALSWVRKLADPIHDELFTTYKQKMKKYRLEKTQWDYLGKKRAQHPEPELPPMKLFFIAGDNSSTGIQENLMDNDGVGLICESEADTMSTAISTDYGHWSHTLRQAFDHDRLSYNRRGNHEYRECTQLQLSVLISGTPAQLFPLIPSPENGLFSRELFYYMPPIREWVNQFDLDGEDYGQLFHQWGEHWKVVLHSLQAEVSAFHLQLSPQQQEVFNRRMAQFFSHAGTLPESQMRSTVARMAINICRILCVVGLLRSLEGIIESVESDPSTPLKSLSGQLLACPGLSPCPHTPLENIADGMAHAFILTLTSADFEAVLSLIEPLYRHSCYVLRFLPNSEVNKRQTSAQEAFFSSLPMKFTRQEAIEKAQQNGIGLNTLDSLLKRMSDKGLIESIQRGKYQFSSRMRIRVKGEGGCKQVLEKPVF